MWYYEQNSTQQGPVDEQTIAGLIMNRQIGAQSLVWRDGMPDWQPLAATELGRMLAAPAPVMGVPQAAPPGALNPYRPPQAAAYHMAAAAATEMPFKQVLFSFEGRIPRRQYWKGLLFWMLIIFVVGIIGAVIGATVNAPEIILLPLIPVMIVYIWSAIALQVKRWHDRDKSGAMVLINLIPYLGGIWAFVECGCLRGSQGANRFGADPT